MYTYNYNIIKMIYKKKKDKLVQTTRLSLHIKIDKGEEVRPTLGPTSSPHGLRT